jgi:hypothetical protein
MRLTVLSVAFPFAAVGPDAVGGAEQVMWHLDRALVRAGHRSIVVACEGSQTAGDLVPTPVARGPLDDSTRRRIHRAHRARIDYALARWNIHVVHFHGIDFDCYLPPRNVPALVTLHLPAPWYSQEVFRLPRPRTYLHCVSKTQSRTCPESPSLLPVIQNGVPVEALEARHAKRRYALTLGRICAEKNFHVALDGSGIPVRKPRALLPFPAPAARRRAAPLSGPARVRAQAQAHDCGALPARSERRTRDELARRDGSVGVRHPGHRFCVRRAC